MSDKVNVAAWFGFGRVLVLSSCNLERSCMDSWSWWKNSVLCTGQVNAKSLLSSALLGLWLTSGVCFDVLVL